jgi:hypothetical protein
MLWVTVATRRGAKRPKEWLTYPFVISLLLSPLGEGRSDDGEWRQFIAATPCYNSNTE